MTKEIIQKLTAITFAKIMSGFALFFCGLGVWIANDIAGGLQSVLGYINTVLFFMLSVLWFFAAFIDLSKKQVVSYNKEMILLGVILGLSTAPFVVSLIALISTT